MWRVELDAFDTPSEETAQVLRFESNSVIKAVHPVMTDDKVKFVLFNKAERKL